MGSFTGTVPSFAAGQKGRASELQTLANIATALTDPWTPYTPIWTASAGTPSIGNGSLTGAYRLVGHTLDFQVQLIGGSTTTYGTAGASWSFSIPPGLVAARTVHGVGHALDQGSAEIPLTWRIIAGQNGTDLFRTATNARFLNNNPFTFGTTDILTANGTIEVQ